MDYGGVFGAAVQALGSMANSAIHYYQQRKLMKKQQKYNQENMQLQDSLNRAFSKDMTSWQNLYVPGLKVQGLRDAGINPILGYDTGIGNLATESLSASGTSALSAQGPNIDLLGSYNSALQAKEQKARSDRAVDIVGSEISQREANTTLQEQQSETEAAHQDMYNAQAEKTRVETENAKLEGQLKSATNARDIERAKKEFAAESGIKFGVGHDGEGHVFDINYSDPYSRMIRNRIENNTYLNSRERSIALDAVNALGDVGSAYRSFKGYSGPVHYHY